MKTLKEIKNNYAKEQGYDSWMYLERFNFRKRWVMSEHWHNICILTQKQALKNASKSFPVSLHKHYILNENNLVKWY